MTILGPQVSLSGPGHCSYTGLQQCLKCTTLSTLIKDIKSSSCLATPIQT